MKIKNIFLALSLALFAIGFSDLQENLFFWVGRPAGALLFGVYMIFTVLEGEVALMDEQERANRPSAQSEKNDAAVASGAKHSSALAAATSP